MSVVRSLALPLPNGAAIGSCSAASSVEAHDIELPLIPGFSSPNLTPHPDMEPFDIYEDDRVREANAFWT